MLLWCYVWALPGKCLKDIFSFHMSLQATKYSVMGNIASKLQVQWPLYKSTLRGSDSVVWSDGTVNEQWIRKVMEGRSCELILDAILVFAWRAWGTCQYSLLMAEIWTQDLQFTKQECCPAVCDVWCFLTGMNQQTHSWVSVDWMCELEALTRIYGCFFLLSVSLLSCVCVLQTLNLCDRMRNTW